MRICIANKRDGGPCTLSAQPHNRYCWAHAPENAEQRRQTASKAGSAEANGEISTIKQRLREVAEGVLDGTTDKGWGSVSFQGFGVLIRAIEVERKVRETEELAAELEEIRALVNERARGWGG